MFNYATKSDLKDATSIDISKFAKKDDLVGLKSDVDKLDIGKLETTLTDLSKLSNVVRNDVVKETVYDELANASQTIDTSDLVKKLTMTHKMKILKRKFLVMINMLLLMVLINFQEQYLMKD